MSTITPMLDTLLPQVLGRRADMARFTGARVNIPLGPVDPVASVRTDGFDRPTPGTGADATRARGSGEADPSTQGGGARRTGEQPGAREIATGTRYLPAAKQPPAGPHTESARAQFSREGGLIASLLARRPAPVAHTTPAHAAALFGAARVPATPILAAILGQQVAHSGLFYESHLSKWFDGQRPLTELLEEPHNQKTQNPASQGDARASSTHAPATNTRQSLANASANALLAPGAFDTAAAQGRGDGARGDVVDERLLSVVRQQLDVLSNSVFRWHGDAWPGVDMQWEIHEHGDDGTPRRGQDEQGEASFSTRLRLELPRLGPVEIALNLAGGAIEVYAFASSAQGAATLAPATGELKARFEQAGFDRAHVELIEEAVE
ncbi:hypothetical protein S4A8_15939 [Salinisphaera sp. S4-8]|uniref:flagellar hook-length control protein FliK n=1 Tax=Salinisphaera sp. S4-8 TaxID=633357 RepID=UPI003340F388